MPQKRVRFHPCLVTSHSRPPTEAEQWILQDFEYHVWTCRTCAFPYLKALEFSPLCKTGSSYARRLALYFYESGQKIYSTDADERPVVVEVPQFFRCCFEVLKSAEWHCRKRSGQKCNRTAISRVVRRCRLGWEGGILTYYEDRTIW